MEYRLCENVQTGGSGRIVLSNLPGGFWVDNFPYAMARYNLLESPSLACYIALVKTAQLLRDMR